MQPSRKLYALLGGLFSSVAFGQEPAITEILNNYSLNTVRSGSIGIAQGAIFIVKGSRLTDTPAGLQTTYPLRSTLNGVRIRITVGTVQTYALMYYALPAQLAGILPSSTPTGPGLVVVENNSRASRAFPIQIARTSFGTLTLNGTGKGPAGVHDENYKLLGSTNATNPGKNIVLYGSGLGGTVRDESMPHTGANATGDLIESGIDIRIGGKSATILYRGRTQFPGLDQINVLVPQLEPESYGCEVPVVIRNAAELGNPTYIPVVESGTVCTPATSVTTPGIVTSAAILSEAEINELVSRGTVRVGQITLNRSAGAYFQFLAVPPTRHLVVADLISGAFVRYGSTGLREFLTNLTKPPLPTASLGTCSASPVGVTAPPEQVIFDPGTYLTVTGPAGVRIVAHEFTTLPTHASIAGDGTPGNFFDEGTYVFSAPGGRDIPPFRISAPVPQIVWSNKGQSSVVRRQDGLPVSWTGGAPGEVAFISITQLGSAGTPVATLMCYALRERGQFTIPAADLARLVASPVFPGTTSVIPALIGVGTLALVQAKVPNVDLMFVYSVTADYGMVEFQ